jgi:hypothetical protein
MQLARQLIRVQVRRANSHGGNITENARDLATHARLADAQFFQVAAYLADSKATIGGELEPARDRSG